MKKHDFFNKIALFQEGADGEEVFDVPLLLGGHNSLNFFLSSNLQKNISKFIEVKWCI